MVIGRCGLAPLLGKFANFWLVYARRRSAGMTTMIKRSSALQISTLAPLANVEPRTRAASSMV